MADLTPMMQQYMATKEQYKDCILFYRLGDFYEMFFDDALVASKELEITLTGKNCGQEERAPMCGIPYHAADSYLTKLVNKGYKVAICEQVEDPKLAKGIVKREVIRIVTPGTNLNMMSLEESRNNYLMCIAYTEDKIGIAVVDALTGDFYVTEVSDTKKLNDEIVKFSPSEIICNDNFLVSGYSIDDLRERLGISINKIDAWHFEEDSCQKLLCKHFKVNTLTALGVDDFMAGQIAAGAVLAYLYETQKNSLSNITHLNPYIASKYMLLDSATRRNLELTETLREKQKKGSLLWVLDKTKTAMGARLLRTYLEQPLIEQADIVLRQEAVGDLLAHPMSREELREYLSPIYDLERLLGKISYKTANPRDLIAFRNSLQMLPPIKTVLAEFETPLLQKLQEQIDDLTDLYGLIDAAIVEEPPLSSKEGGIIKEGFSEDADTLRRAKTDGKKWLAELENTERERTGIKNLRIKYNKVFGYYLEVTNSFKDQVPDDYIRKQTLTNAERYTMPKLKEMEDTILNAEDKLYSLEYELFCQVRDALGDNMQRVQQTAKAIAGLDVFASLAYVAERNHYVKPKITTKGVIDIKEGRHPVVECMIKNDMFIANDTYLDSGKNLISIITGPNMAGKSTYMRQTALIVLLAQIGSFVPAKSAQIGIVDRIFTRVGASDDLASGQSTFMVEMNEAADILNNVSSRSLVLFDELGRGTSTYDGISIAWAIVEYIHEHPKAKARTLFATHYHELNEMEKSFKRIKNYNVSVKEVDNKVIFLRKLERGGSEHSFGIHVAKMAGMPKSIVKRANTILKQLESDNRQQGISGKPLTEVSENRSGMQLSFFQLDDPILCQIRDEILNLDVNNLTPIEALNKLNDIKKIVRGK